MAGGSGAIRAGRAFVELFLQDNKFYRALEGAAARFSRFGNTLAKGGAVAGAAGGAILAPITNLFTDALKQGAAIQALANKFGTTTENVSGLAFAFERGGVNLEQFGGVLDSLAGKVKTAADNNEELIQGLQGLRGRDLIKRDVGEQLDMIAEKFKTITLAQDQVTVANELGMASIINTLKKGKAGLDEMRAKGAGAGAIFSAEEAGRSKAVLDEYRDTLLAVKYAFLEIGKALIPQTEGVKDLGTAIRIQVAGVREWITENKGLVVSITALAGGIVAGGLALTGFGIALKIATPAVGLLVSGLKLLASGLAFLLTPFGAITAALGGITVAFFTLTDAGKETGSKLMGTFRELGSTFGEIWEGIVAAVKTGNLKIAFDTLGAGIRVAWAALMLALRKGWNDLMTGIIEGLRANPWILPLIGGVVGGVMGGPQGAVIGAATGATAAAGIEIFADKITNALTANTDKAQGKLNEALKDFRLVVAQAKGLQAATPAEVLRAGGKSEDYFANKFNAATQYFDRVKGTFALPSAEQQLGYGDTVGKRQLNAQNKGNEIAANILKGVLDTPKQIIGAFSFK